jgi:hypothetical protein
MICPIKTDPNWIALEQAQPDLAYYLWNEYEGNVPAEYYTSTAPIKPGVEGLFNENPELASVGTQEQYSAYLDTIFPDSQVKDIVYHGSLENISKFNENQHFGTIDQANLRILRKADDEDRYDDIRIYSALINVNNSKEVEDVGFDWSKEIQKAKKEGFDSLTYFNEGENYMGSKGNYKYSDNSYLVFNSENSYILGNKQDIEGFKKFVQSDQLDLDIDIENCNLPS